MRDNGISVHGPLSEGLDFRSVGTQPVIDVQRLRKPLCYTLQADTSRTAVTQSQKRLQHLCETGNRFPQDATFAPLLARLASSEQSSHNSVSVPNSAEQKDTVPLASSSAGQEKPFWVILEPLEHFISGHDTLAEAEGEAQRLNAQAQQQGRPPHYGTKPRPHGEG